MQHFVCCLYITYIKQAKIWVMSSWQGFFLFHLFLIPKASYYWYSYQCCEKIPAVYCHKSINPVSHYTFSLFFFAMVIVIELPTNSLYFIPGCKMQKFTCIIIQTKWLKSQVLRLNSVHSWYSQVTWDKQDFTRELKTHYLTLKFHIWNWSGNTFESNWKKTKIICNSNRRRYNSRQMEQ